MRYSGARDRWAFLGGYGIDRVLRGFGIGGIDWG